MPYSTMDYQPPSLPEIRQIKSFDEVRNAIQEIMQYLQRLVAADMAYFQHLKHNVNHASVAEGPPLQAAATISPSHFIHVVEGTATITTIERPANFIGHLLLISQDGLMLDQGGNIKLIEPPNYLKPTGHINLTYVPSMDIWVTDTCRLQNTPTTMRIGGRTVQTT